MLGFSNQTPKQNGCSEHFQTHTIRFGRSENLLIESSSGKNLLFRVVRDRVEVLEMVVGVEVLAENGEAEIWRMFYTVEVVETTPPENYVQSRS